MTAPDPTPVVEYHSSTSGAVAGVAVQCDEAGLTVSVDPVPEGRRMALGAASVVGIVVGPLAAVVMLAVGMGWVGPLIILGIILAPAVLVRLIVLAAERDPVEGPEAVFRLDREHLELTVQVRGGVWVKRWRRQDVDGVRPGWFGAGLVIRAKGRVSAEALHWHPLRVRARVAEVLNREIPVDRGGGGEGYNPAGAGRANPSPARRRARAVL